MEPSIAVAAARPTQRTAHFVKQNLREYGMLLSLVAIMVFFQVVTDGTLLQPLNLTNLVLQNSYIVIMAMGMLLVIVAGTKCQPSWTIRTAASAPMRAPTSRQASVAGT